jgi:hypothetical protein
MYRYPERRLRVEEFECQLPSRCPGGAGRKPAGGTAAEKTRAEPAVRSPASALDRGRNQSAESAGGKADSDTVACWSAVGHYSDRDGHNGTESIRRIRQSVMGRVHRIACLGNRGQSARDSPASATNRPGGSPAGAAY